MPNQQKTPKIKIKFRCPNCGNRVESTWIACPACAQNLQVRCPSCNVPIKEGATRCPNCGGQFEW
jgi:predicted RNA-binding Zn-ribbon protein involved in translation (DUF1610 family)